MLLYNKHVMAHTPETRARALAKVLRRREQWVSENGPCIKCSSSHDLHVHHRDPTQKVSHRIWSYRAAKRAAELAKCEVLCRACHSATHSLLTRKAHGIGGYRRGCRCDVCRAARSAQCARYRERHGAKLRAKALAYQAEYSFRDRYEVLTGEGESQT
jgi:hypothetical protein